MATATGSTGAADVKPPLRTEPTNQLTHVPEGPQVPPVDYSDKIEACKWSFLFRP